MTGPRITLTNETAAVGACMFSTQALADVTRTLTPEDIHNGAVRTIYEAVLRLHSRGDPVDYVTVADELAAHRYLEAVGGLTAVMDVGGACPVAGNGGYYARRAAQQAYDRRVEAVLANLSADDATEALETLQAAVATRPTVAASRRFRRYTVADLDTLPPPEWLVDGLIPEGLSVVYGPSGANKSFLTIDWACSVASGRRWFGRRVRLGKVLYVVAEGASGMAGRLAAWRHDRGVPTLDRLELVTVPLNLLDVGWADDLVAETRELGAAVVVLDTLARNMVGDENATADMAAFVRVCDRLRVEAEASVWVVHHSGLEQGRMRGNTALYGAADAVVAVSTSGVDTVVGNEPPAGKQKDAAPDRPWRLRRKAVGGSCVLTLSSVPSDPHGMVLARLRDAAGWVAVDDLLGCAGSVSVLADLEEDGRVVKDGGMYRVNEPL